MFRRFSILCSLGVFLGLVTLIACSGSPTGNGGSGGGNSSSSFGIAPPSAAGDGTVIIENLAVTPRGLSHEFLDITGAAIAAHPDSILSKVDILLGGRKILDITLGGPNDISYTIDMTGAESARFNGEECCGESCEVYVTAYMNGKAKVQEKKTVTRDTDRCRVASSSSVVPSSSSAEVVRMTLDPLFDGEILSVVTSGSGAKGIKLSDGSSTTNASEADLYLLNSCNGFETRGNARIVYEFDLKDYGSTTGRIDKDMRSTPENTSQFVFSANSGDWDSEISYMKDIYFVACQSVKTKWDNDCYLVLFADACMEDGSTSKLGIKVWKAR